MRSKLQRRKVGVCPAMVCAAAVLMAALILLLPLRAHRFEGKTSHQRASTVVAAGTTGTAADNAEPVVRARAVESYGRLPLSFEANQGQTDRQVRFLSRGSGYSLFLTGSEAVLSLRKPSAVSQQLTAATGSADLAFRSAAFGVAKGFPRPQRHGPQFNPVAFPRLLRSPGVELETDSRTADPKTGSALPTYRTTALAPLGERVAIPQTRESRVSGFKETVASEETLIADPESQAPAVLHMELVGANAAAKVTGLEELPGKSNYFIGNDPKKWRTNVPNYAKVKYANVYPGVDLVYYGNQGQLEYDFVVAPGADPRQITLGLGSHESKIQNLKSKIVANGDLVVGTEGGEVVFHKPVVYQPTTYNELRTTNGGGRDLVEGKYVLRGDNRIAFELANYDRRRPVVIDPVLAYSTYLGGSNEDAGAGIAVDASGNAYVVGFTYSSDFPTTPGAFQTVQRGICAAFISKLNAAGSALVYSTYLGGDSCSGGLGIAVDASENVYVTGQTNSPDFPTTPGAFQGTLFGGQDAFISKLNPAGSALVYSTYLGGSNADQGNAIAVDASDDAYVTGYTRSSDFPTTAGAFQGTLFRDQDAFISKLNPAGSALVYSTYLGGSYTDFDEGTGIAVDASGDAYVTGQTHSRKFPTTAGAFQTTLGGYVDAFVSKLNAAGSALVYSTYLGGSTSPEGTAGGSGSAIAVDASGRAYVIGETDCSDFPITPGAFQTIYGGQGDASITKLNAAGTDLLYSTYLGGSSSDFGLGIAVDTSGNAYVTGQTTSSDFPTTPGALQASYGGYGDAFVIKLNATGTTLLYSTYFGGKNSYESSAGGAAITVDTSDTIYVTGGTSSSDFPVTPSAFQTAFVSPDGQGDAFVAKIGLADAPGLALGPARLTFGPQTLGTTSSPQTVTLLDAGSQPLSITSIVASGDFAQTNTCPSTVPSGTSCTITVTFTPTATGTRTGAVTLADNAAGSPHKLLLTGTGTGGAPAVTLAPAGVPFLVLRTVGTTSLRQTVKLTNVGGGQLNITGITVTGPDGGDFAQSNNCMPTVAAGGSCLITVTFTPTAQGVRTASVSIADNASGSPQTVPLTGRGTFIEWSPRSMNMGSQTVGTSSAAQTVTLTNAGTAPIALFSIVIGGVDAGDFSETNTCGSSLNAGASCTIEVTFTPTEVGSRLGRVAIHDNAFGSPHMVGLLGKGT
jgi:hypothetical protein